MFLRTEQKMVIITDSKKWFGSGLLKSFSENLGRSLFELRTWELSQKLKCKGIFVFHSWCFLSVFALTKTKFSVEKPWLVCGACVFSIFKCPIYRSSNKQYMTPTFIVDVSKSNILQQEQIWLETLSDTFVKTKADWKLQIYFLRENKGYFKGVFTLNR